MKTITNEKRSIIVQFPYDPKTVAAIKAVGGFKYQNEGIKKYWKGTLNRKNYQNAKQFALDNGFVFNVNAPQFEKPETGISKDEAMTNLLNSAVWVKLKDFQKEGAKFLVENRKVLLGDDPGLGKTVQSLIAAFALGEKILIVTKSSLKINWMREIHKWFGEDISINLLEGRKPKDLPVADCYIINYDILSGWAEYLTDQNFGTVIFDESHKLKNKKAQCAKAGKLVADLANNVFALTGTPIMNRPFELTHQLECINKIHYFTNSFMFGMRYCDGKRGKFGYDFSGASNLEELNQKLIGNGIMLRRRKKEVLKELPDSSIQKVYFDISNREEYDYAQQEFVEWLQQTLADEDEFLARIAHLPAQKQAQAKWTRNQALAGNVQAEHLVRTEKLKQLAANGKLKAVVEWVEDFLESDSKLIIFAHHKSIQKALIQAFPEAVSILAEDSAEYRDRSVQEFQNNPKVRLIICSLEAAAEGLTLTAASDVAFVEYAWTPAKMEQAISRAHRIGQKNCVVGHYLVGVNTIDEYICDLLASKQAVIDAAIEGKSVSLTGSVLSDLIHIMEKK